MNEPVQLDELYHVAEQIIERDLAIIKAAGYERVINNRPDGESDDQPLSEALKAQAKALGLEYIANPIDLKFLSGDHVKTQAQAISTPKKTLAFCRTGTRSSLLWVLLHNHEGEDYQSLVAHVSAKGYDLSRCAAAMDPLSQ